MIYNRNFLFACTSRKRCNSLLLLYHCVLRDLGIFCVSSMLTESHWAFDDMLFYHDASSDLSQRWLFAKFIRELSHYTVYVPSLSALFLWKSMTRVWIAVVSIHRLAVLSNRRIVQFLQSLIYFRIRQSPSCPQGWRIPDGTSGSASWSWNKSGRGPLNIESDRRRSDNRASTRRRRALTKSVDCRAIKRLIFDVIFIVIGNEMRSPSQKTFPARIRRRRTKRFMAATRFCIQSSYSELYLTDRIDW